MSYYFNVMERIRKAAGLPTLVGGVPPVGHRTKSHWAAYTTAVETISREVVSDLVACKEHSSKLAGEKSELAGKLAEIHEEKFNVEKRRISSEVVARGLTSGLTPAQREEMVNAVNGK